ncbi:MAG: M23 family metallopeptidase [Roseburia sp.]|nr:M23 family metallopeptidase [Roseburia sp.]
MERRPKRNRKARTGKKWKIFLAAILFFMVPVETGWILGRVKADAVLPLAEDMEEFRCFDIKAEELANEQPFTEKYYRRLAKRLLFGGESVSLSFSLQLRDEVLASYSDAYATVLSDVRCFPVAFDGTGEATISYENSWGNARNYGGDRRHEGVDLMTSNQIPGYFPAVSVCDGIVEKIGWLELGGYRVGIRSEHGMYAYYAHLDSYKAGLDAGDHVKAGETLGYVGNTGYGEEGTRGKFDVHLHFGMYIDIEGKEISINPYEILRYLES